MNKKAVNIISGIIIAVFFALTVFLGALEIKSGGADIIVNGKSSLTDEAATVKATVLYRLFGASGSDQVIAGKDGWLFYNETLNDYIGAAAMTDEEIDKFAEKLTILGEYCRENGAELCILIAPNKNTVYPEKMPDWFKKGEMTISNRSRLLEKLSAGNIYAPDLAAMIKAVSNDLPDAWKRDDRVENMSLYYKTDTHWNALGAAVAADYIIGNFAADQLNDADNPGFYLECDIKAVRAASGDLYDILYPSKKIENGVDITDFTYSFEGQKSFEYVDEPFSMMDMDIRTVSGIGGGDILVYRDSFGSELIPLLSGYFSTAHYLRGNMPYVFTYVATEKPGTVVMVIAERNLKQLLNAEFSYDPI